MAGRSVIKGAQPVEWLPEGETFADETIGGEVGDEWNWFGIGTSFNANTGVESESITYLPEFGAANKLEKRMNIKHREMWEADITYHPQEFDFLQYWTGAIGGTSDDPETIQVGMIDEDNDEFARLLGGMGEDVTISGSEDATWEFDGSFIFADGTEFTATDYTETDGTHATEDTTEPFKWSDLSNVQYGGVQMGGAIEGLEISVSNDIAIVTDPDAPRDTLIDGLHPVDREITVDVDITYENFGMLEEVRAYEPKDLTFDIGTTSFTIQGVQFPEAPFEFTPDDLISDSISSDPASSLTWA